MKYFVPQYFTPISDIYEELMKDVKRDDLIQKEESPQKKEKEVNKTE